MRTFGETVGIGLRREHYDSILKTPRTVGWLEIVPENFVGRDGLGHRLLRECAERWPVVAHGVSLCVGTPDPLDFDYLRGLKRLLDEIGATYYTDHLCYSAIDGITFHDLLPLPFSDEAVELAAARIRQISDILERPVAVENITYYATMPGGHLREGEFVRAVVELAGCDLLLDLNNVYVNARNHGRDPLEVLWDLPVERTRQIHLAGHSREYDGRLLDDHGAPMDDAVLGLYEAFVDRFGPVATLLEWDTRIPALDVVLDEAERARSVIRSLAVPQPRHAAGEDAP